MKDLEAGLIVRALNLFLKSNEHHLQSSFENRILALKDMNLEEVLSVARHYHSSDNKVRRHLLDHYFLGKAMCLYLNVDEVAEVEKWVYKKGKECNREKQFFEKLRFSKNKNSTYDTSK